MSFLSALPAILSGVGSLMTALGGNKTTTTVDYEAMVKSAEAAGINPLTALRNGGAAGFAVTSHPALTSWGNALQGVGNSVSEYQLNQKAEDRALLEQQLMEAQLDNIQADTALMLSKSFEVPTATGATRDAGHPFADVGYADPEPVVQVRVGGNVASPDLGWSNAQEIEDRYGDLFGSVAGFGVLGADLWSSFWEGIPEATAQKDQEIQGYISSGTW